MRILLAGRSGPLGQALEEEFKKCGQLEILPGDPLNGAASPEGAEAALKTVSCDAVLIYPVFEKKSAGSAPSWVDNISRVSFLLEGLRRLSKPPHIVMLSSGLVYGAETSEKSEETSRNFCPVNEKHRCRPLSFEGISMAVGDLMAEQYRRAYKLDITVLRVFALADFKKRRLICAPSPWPQSGADLIGAADLAEAVCSAIVNDKCRNGTYNVCSGVLSKVLPAGFRADEVPLCGAGSAPAEAGDPSLFESMTGWKAEERLS